MITREELLDLKEKTDTEVAEITGDIAFDHFAIKTPNNETYEKLCSVFGGKFQEFFQSGRNIATVISEFGTIEIMEPKKDEDIKEAFINHVGYVTEKIDDVEAKFNRISKFEIGNTAILFIKPSATLIQIRNKPLKDYSE